MASALDPAVGTAGVAPPTPLANEPLAEIASEVASDAGTLLEKHVALFKAEMVSAVQDAKVGAAMTGVGAALAVFGAAFLPIGLVKLFAWLAAPHLPEWACWLIGGGAFLLLGGILAYAGVRMVTRIDLVPHRTLHNLQETWSWIVKRRT